MVRFENHFSIHWNGWFSLWFSSIFIENVGFARHDLGTMNLNNFRETSNSIATALIWVKTAMKPLYSTPFSKRWKFTFLVKIEWDEMTILIFFWKHITNTENSNFLGSRVSRPDLVQKHGRRHCFVSKFCKNHVVCTESHGIPWDPTEFHGIKRNSAKSGSKPEKYKRRNKNFGIL